MAERRRGRHEEMETRHWRHDQPHTLYRGKTMTNNRLRMAYMVDRRSSSCPVWSVSHKFFIVERAREADCRQWRRLLPIEERRLPTEEGYIAVSESECECDVCGLVETVFVDLGVPEKNVSLFFKTYSKLLARWRWSQKRTIFDCRVNDCCR